MTHVFLMADIMTIRCLRLAFRIRTDKATNVNPAYLIHFRVRDWGHPSGDRTCARLCELYIRTTQVLHGHFCRTDVPDGPKVFLIYASMKSMATLPLPQCTYALAAMNYLPTIQISCIKSPII